VVYLDPRFTKTAGKASEWLPIKPGTDLAFHLALLNVVISENLYDSSFVMNYTLGFEELQKDVTSYTPEWAAGITGIDAGTIRRIARDFAAARPHAFAHPNWRTSNFQNSFHTERAIAVLNALVGLNYQPFGSCPLTAPESLVTLGSPQQPAYPRITAQRLDGVPEKYPLVPRKIGVFQELRDSVLTGEPYQAHGWFISRQNPAMSLPERKKTVEAFNKLDLMVVVDIFVNDTGWYADYILPEATYLERYDPVNVVGKRVFLRQPVVEPLGESKSALWIYKELGTRLGLGDFFNYKDEEDYIKQQIAPLGADFDAFKQLGYFDVDVPDQPIAYKWNTPSGKIEIASETLRSAGFPAVPTWVAPPEPPQGQFYLLTGKVGQHTQFGTQNNLFLHEVYPKNALWMHTKPAAERGIKNGQTVKVTSAAGEVEIEVLVTEGIREDCVYMAPGFGHISKGLKTAYGQGASSSDLHLTYTDPISGGQALSQTFVTVEPVASLSSVFAEVSHV
jgi:thiosulfate reductase/polysulfide reductase chain A